MCCLCHRPICVCIHNYGLVCTQTLLPVRGWVWRLILPRSFLRAGMLPSLLMRERTQHQPTSIQVLLMAGTFENWSSTWPIVLKVWKRNLNTMAFQQETSEQGYSQSPFLTWPEGSGVQTTYGAEQLAFLGTRQKLLIDELTDVYLPHLSVFSPLDRRSYNSLQSLSNLHHRLAAI